MVPDYQPSPLLSAQENNTADPRGRVTVKRMRIRISACVYAQNEPRYIVLASYCVRF